MDYTGKPTLEHYMAKVQSMKIGILDPTETTGSAL